MIDRSVPYYDVIMCLPKEAPRPAPPALPPGFGLRLFMPGDEGAWCRIETAVGEFEREAQALAYFERVFAPHPQALSRRMLFVTDDRGVPVADAAAWWAEDEELGRVPLLHWVAVAPDFQGRGLGRAVCAGALSLLWALGPPGDIWLTTQTTSHVAITLYLDLGFRPHPSIRLAGHANGYAGAARVLRGVLRDTAYARFCDTAPGPSPHLP